ncbi:Glutamate receptor 2 [Diplonema papillatum]|nr:Glutamate receptor 2 [Diplonema papillatum]
MAWFAGMAGLLLLACQADAAVKIGVLWPTSEASLSLAVDTAATGFLQENGGFNVEVNYSASTVGTSQAVHDSLCGMLAAGDYIGFVGPASSLHATFAASTASKHNIPLISPMARTPLLGEADRDGSFRSFRRTCGTVNAEATALRRFFEEMSEWDGMRAIVMSTSTDVLFEQTVRKVIAGFALAKVNVVSTINVNETASGRIAALNQVREMLAQIVVVIGPSNTVTSLLSMATDHATAMLPGIIWLVSEDTASAGAIDTTLAAKLDGLFGIRHLGSPETNSHYVRLRDALGKPPSVHESRAYDAAWVLLESAKQSGVVASPPLAAAQCSEPGVLWTQGNKLLEAIDAIDHSGASGRINLSPQHGFDYELVNMVNGVWGSVGTYTTATDAVFISPDVHYRGGRQPSLKDILNGQHLNILFIEFKPFVFQDPPGSGNYRGLIFDLINKLSTRLNFTYTRHVQDGDWAGGIVKVSKGLYDLQAADTGITHEREQLVDFTQPFVETTSVLMVRRPKHHESIYRFLEPFSGTVWLALFITIILSSFVFWALEGGCLAKDIAERSWGESYVPTGTHGAENSFWFVCSAMLQVHTSEPITRAGRIMGLGLYWLAMTTIATYTAELAAYLSTAPTVYPVETFNEFLDGQLPVSKLGVRPGTVNSDYIAQAVGPNFYQLVDDGDEEMLNGSVIATVQDSIWADFFTQQAYDPPPSVCAEGAVPQAAPTSTRSFRVQSAAVSKHPASRVQSAAASKQSAGTAASRNSRHFQVLKGGGGGAAVGQGARATMKLEPIDGCSAKGTCAFELRGPSWNPRGVGLPLKKGSPFVGALSQEILALRENNFIANLTEVWFAGECTGEGEVAESETLGVHQFAGVFILYGVAVGLAFSGRIARMIFNKKKPKPDGESNDFSNDPLINAESIAVGSPTEFNDKELVDDVKRAMVFAGLITAEQCRHPDPTAAYVPVTKTASEFSINGNGRSGIGYLMSTAYDSDATYPTTPTVPPPPAPKVNNSINVTLTPVHHPTAPNQYQQSALDSTEGRTSGTL